MREKIAGNLFWAAVIGVGILIVLSIAPLSLGFLDRKFSPLGHLAGSSGLAVVIGLSFMRRLEATPDHRLLALFALAVSSIFWFLVEVLQIWMPEHGAEVSDLLFDAAGAVVGALAVFLMSIVLSKLRQGVFA
ncbi:MAG: hypothetical protein WD231_03495 [Candidatus Woykebacteria bacterium]